MNKANNTGLLYFGLLLAIGLSVGGYFISQTLYNSKVALNTAEAKGLAERRVESDSANWEIKFKISGKTKEAIPALYKISEQNQQIIVNLLKESGFDENEIKLGVLDYNSKEFRDSKQNLVDQKHELVGSVRVEKSKVQLISATRASVNQLIAQGIDIENGTPSYHFTKLNEIKPEILREAAKNDRIAATEFSANAGIKVGGIKSARQGNFNIRDVGENYGDTRKIEKDVRVVTTIVFYLTD